MRRRGRLRAGRGVAVGVVEAHLAGVDVVLPEHAGDAPAGADDPPRFVRADAEDLDRKSVV